MLPAGQGTATARAVAMNLTGVSDLLPRPVVTPIGSAFETVTSGGYGGYTRNPASGRRQEPAAVFASNSVCSADHSRLQVVSMSWGWCRCVPSPAGCDLTVTVDTLKCEVRFNLD